MIWGLLTGAAFLLLGAQVLDWAQTGKWESVTVATFFKIQADTVFVSWVGIDKIIHYLVFNIDLWVVCMVAALPIMWLSDKMPRGASKGH